MPDNIGIAPRRATGTASAVSAGFDRKVAGQPAGAVIRAQHALGNAENLGESAAHEEVAGERRTHATGADGGDRRRLVAAHGSQHVGDEMGVRHSPFGIETDPGGAQRQAGLGPFADGADIDDDEIAGLGPGQRGGRVEDLLGAGRPGRDQPARDQDESEGD